ncbi:MAG TPA: gamma carbonic anhydrase family protein, partial [Acidimicrobiia bacterium]|nr:gamma carbonic anhydrase family protein [Acidimicrobiia bacterium]
QPVIHPSSLLAPGSHVYGQVDIGPEVFVLFGAVIRAEFDRISIGAQTNIQDNAVLHCDEDIPGVIGARVTIGHSVVVHGAEVGDGALIGIGARVLNRAVVGEGAWLAAGSVLTEGKTIPPWTLAVGIPARPIRELTDDEVRRADEGVQHYLDLAKAYREIFSSDR